jgi:outer membrane receptor protein involved in Fe transport
LSFDIAAYRNDYDDLQTVEPHAPVFVLTPPLPYIVLPQDLENLLQGRAEGGTVVANWQPLERWRLRFQYAYLHLELWHKPGSLDTSRVREAGNSPEDQAAVYSFVDFPHNLEFYAGVRYVDALPNLAVESYVAVDTSLSWTPRPRLRTSLSVANLTDARHIEFAPGNEIERSAVLRFRWSF